MIFSPFATVMAFFCMNAIAVRFICAAKIERKLYRLSQIYAKHMNRLHTWNSHRRRRQRRRRWRQHTWLSHFCPSKFIHWFNVWACVAEAIFGGELLICEQPISMRKTINICHRHRRRHSTGSVYSILRFFHWLSNFGFFHLVQQMPVAKRKRSRARGWVNTKRGWEFNIKIRLYYYWKLK